MILVLEFQLHHSLSDSGLGALYSLLSVVALAAMLLAAPRLQRLPLGVIVPASLATLGIGAFTLAARPRSLLVLTFPLVGMGNGLIDVFLNVAGQREEARTHRPVLQWLHASYALGGVTGAAAAGVLRSADLTTGSASRLRAWRCWRRRCGIAGGPRGSPPPKGR